MSPDEQWQQTSDSSTEPSLGGVTSGSRHPPTQRVRVPTTSVSFSI
jgi:hypothetical protein